MIDLIERLRSLAHAEHDDLSVADEAADAIERLRRADPAAVQQVAYETDITPETVEVIWRRMVELSGPPPEDSGP